ncbi:RidA family protein [Microvirga brassicacearum]|uniref:Deaminase n=1 Tax=Microvirga brassicacearum TaxID=2580413 RepID=A0A5N3PCB2_9HYPH|nr:Rid family detoxifying hydrolase [Microvirga brassicacearum]KAB0267343.1 deaminase [Microvirga brassicacearum]
MIRDTILSPDAPKPLGPYSQAVRAGGLLFVAGQLPLDDKGVLVGENDAAQQTETVLAHMAAILREAGSSMDKVVKTTVFLTNLDDFEAMNDVYARHFSAPFPARSTVGISRLPKGMLIEIECIALA